MNTSAITTLTLWANFGHEDLFNHTMVPLADSSRLKKQKFSIILHYPPLAWFNNHFIVCREDIDEQRQNRRRSWKQKTIRFVPVPTIKVNLFQTGTSFSLQHPLRPLKRSFQPEVGYISQMKGVKNLDMRHVSVGIPPWLESHH